MSVVVVNHVTLDGVMQGPGRPDEDTRDGFAHGGWGVSSDDPALGAAMGAVMGEDFSWLFGHRTYTGLLEHWNAVGGPFKDGLNGITKYVVSSDADADLPWPNSELISGDVAARVAELRDRLAGNLVIMGSGELIASLLTDGLIDELLLLIDPVTVGGGHPLFPADGVLRRFELVSAESAGGLLVAWYRVLSDD